MWSVASDVMVFNNLPIVNLLFQATQASAENDLQSLKESSEGAYTNKVLNKNTSEAGILKNVYQVYIIHHVVLIVL